MGILVGPVVGEAVGDGVGPSSSGVGTMPNKK